MPWSKRNQWIVVGVVAAAVGVAATCFLHQSGAQNGTGHSQWRAESDTLVQRVEQLSSGGEVDAAASVLEVVLKRPDLVASGQGDRARMAVARAYLAAGRRDQALTQVQAIPWADKGPQIAAEIVGLELAVRWRGLFDDQQILVSGAVTPRNSMESAFGRNEGLWMDRWQQYRALATSLDRGARMVAAEGGRVTLPASTQMMRIARYSRGDGNLAALMTDLGDPQTWDADLALTLVRLHLSEHDMDPALAAGEVLWARHADSAQAGTAFRELREWQLRRRAVGERLRLWDYPAIDQRLDALVTQYPAMAARAESTLRQEREVNQVAMEAGVQKVAYDREVKVEETVIGIETTEMLEVTNDQELVEPKREWHLALDYDGLSFSAEHDEVAAGNPVRFLLDSEHRGEHQIQVYRLSDRKAWEALSAKPSRALLPVNAVAETTVDLDTWTTIGDTQRHPVEIRDLPEGYYAATVSARGCPVVVLAGVTVADPDLHVIAGRTELLAWVVRRATGQAKSGEPVSATVTLVRNVERAAGKAWAAADPAWRSGFTEGFTGTPSTDFRRVDQQVQFTQGLTVGSAAAVVDPLLGLELTGVSDAQGLIRLSLPERLRGRAYQATVRIARPEVAVQRAATFGEDAAWTSRAVAWADKPLARPGETVRFKALLRDFNGDGYRLPVGELRALVRLDNAVLSDGSLALSASGTLAGEVLIPPGAADGELSLVLGDGAPHHLARVERVRLSPLRYEVVGLDAGLQVRAGETVPLTVRLRDRGGEPLAGIAIRCAVSALADGVAIPCEATPSITSDLAGEAHFTIATAAGREVDYHADIAFEYDRRTYRAGHDWQTRTFPFQLDAVLRQRELRVGGVAQVEVRLPVGAEVRLQFAQDGVRRGTPVVAKGRWPAWTQVAMGIADEHLGANALTISAAVLGGGTASRTLALTVQGRQAVDGKPQVALIPVRNRVETGETLPLALGISDPGRDLLILGGARDLLLARVERLEQNAKQSDVVVAPTWAPNLFLSAVGYLPGQGFVSSERRAVEVMPIDRLLTVTVTPARTDLHPGDLVDAVVQVVDWRGQPAADCALSLGVVNELLYQLAEDPTPDLWQYFHTYHRTWGLVEGSIDRFALPHAMFWRSAIFRWQGSGFTGMFGSRSGGGKRRAMAHAGGCRASENARPLLQPEADGTIWWVADLHTDAQGKAVVRFPLPEHAGRFRCTARANDASAAVLVGEVRSMIASREPYACGLDLPDVVVGGDVVPVQIQLANHEDTAQTLIVTLPDGTTREQVLGPHARRMLTVPVAIPRATAPVVEVVRFGELLGERLPLHITVTTKDAGARTVSAQASTLRRLPGHPTSDRLWLVADQAGAVHLPSVIHPGAAVWLRLRSWPDAAERRASVLADWRRPDVPSTLAVMGWLLAEPGAERRAALAKWWPLLGSSPAATVVKQAALRRGEATVGITDLPDDLIGDWLLARGRALGQSLPAPRYRGLVGRNLMEQLAAAATAIAEGWSEGPALWNSARRDLLNDIAKEQQTPLELAIACDAARLAGDVSTSKLFMARLGQCRWDDDLVAVLAVDLLPEQSEVPLNQLTLNVGGSDIVLPAKDFTEWMGMVTGDVRLSSLPGAVVQLELIVQQTLPLPQAPVPTLSLWQRMGEGYEAVPAGQPLWPGRKLVMLVEAPAAVSVNDLSIALPSLLRLEKTTGEVFLIDRWEVSWPLDDFSRDDLVAELQNGRRTDVLTTFIKALKETVSTRTPVGRRLALSKPDDESIVRAGNQVRLSIRGDQRLVFEVSTVGEGNCTWIGTRVDEHQLPDQMLTIAAGTIAEPLTPAVGHPLTNVISAAAKRCTDEELRWLIEDHTRIAIADWERALRILDPAGEQDLDELLAHPEHTRPGHWTQKKIRRWVDEEPLLAADLPLRFMIGDEEPTLASLVELAQTSRQQRLQAWFALPQPQPVAAAPLVNLKRWYDRLHQLGLIQDLDYRAWCWRQELSPELMRRLDYDNTLDAWVAFVRQQLELPLRIGAGVRTGNAVSVWVTLPATDSTGQQIRRDAQPDPGFGGTNLGTAALGDGLVVVALGNEYELRPLQPSPQPRSTLLSLAYTDVPAIEALAHLNVLLANRGLLPVQFAKELSMEDRVALPPVNLRLADVTARDAEQWFAKIIGLKLVRNRQGAVLEPQ